MLNIVGRELWAVLSRSDSPRWYLRRHDCLFPYSLRLRYHLRNSLGERRLMLAAARLMELRHG